MVFITRVLTLTSLIFTVTATALAAPPPREQKFVHPRDVGQFEDGNYHGEGTLTFANGDTYVGQWKNDKKHGLGKYILASGEVAHDGEWENGNPKK